MASERAKSKAVTTRRSLLLGASALSALVVSGCRSEEVV